MGMGGSQFDIVIRGENRVDPAAQAATSALRQLGQQAKGVNQEFYGVRQTVSAVSGALSGASAITRAFGGEHSALAQTLEKTSTALNVVQTGLYATRAAMLALRVVAATLAPTFAATGAAAAGLLVTLGPFIVIGTAVAAIVTLLVLRFRETERAAKQAGAAIPPVSAALDKLHKSGVDAAKGLSEAAYYLLTVASLARKARGEILGVQLSTKGLIGELDLPSFQEFTRLLGEIGGKPKSLKGADDAAAAARKLAAEIERLNEEALRLHGEGITANITELTALGKAFDGAATEAQRFAGWMNKSTPQSAAAAVAVLDEELKRLIRDFEIWVAGINALPGLEFITHDVAINMSKDFTTIDEKLKEAIRDFEIWAAGIREMPGLEFIDPETAKNMDRDFTKIKQVMVDWKKEIGLLLVDSFQRFFEDIITSAKNFGDVLRGFFQSLVNAIVSILARLAATTIVDWLKTIIPALRGTSAITQGGTPSVSLTSQTGTMLANPSLMAQSRREMGTQVVIVFDRNQIPPPPRGYVQQVVITDFNQRGPIYQSWSTARGR